MKTNRSKLAAAALAVMLSLGSVTVPDIPAVYAYAQEAKLDAPEVLSSSADEDSVKLKWKEVKNADGYRVYMYDEDCDIWELIKSVKKPHCTIDSLESGTKYRFKIAPVKKNGKKYDEGTLSKAVTVSTKKAVLLPAPGEFKVSSKSSDSVSLSWGKVTGAYGYRVYIYDEDYDEWEKYKNVTGTSCKVTGLDESTEYKFRITALKKNGEKYTEGEPSGIFKVSTKKKAATQKPATRSTPGEFDLTNLKLGSSKKTAYKDSNMMLIDEKDNMSMGKVKYLGIECTLFMSFGETGKLYTYSLWIPGSYSDYLDVLSALKDGLGYDYYYDDGTYMWTFLDGTSFFITYDFDDDVIQVTEMDLHYE